MVTSRSATLTSFDVLDDGVPPAPISRGISFDVADRAASEAKARGPRSRTRRPRPRRWPAGWASDLRRRQRLRVRVGPDLVEHGGAAPSADRAAAETPVHTARRTVTRSGDIPIP
jgi:hypothetical protein